jgi:hypothetical protein
MGLMRNRAGLIATIALAWHLVAIAAVSTVLSCHQGPSQEHAGMENCPLHSTPVCPLHAEKHGTHDCDCPTIGCARTDAAFTALFGLLGDIPDAVMAPVALDAGDAALSAPSRITLLAPLPLSPPPRT